jgi:hypothetical protein
MKTEIEFELRRRIEVSRTSLQGLGQPEEPCTVLVEVVIESHDLRPRSRLDQICLVSVMMMPSMELPHRAISTEESIIPGRLVFLSGDCPIIAVEHVVRVLLALI